MLAMQKSGVMGTNWFRPGRIRVLPARHATPADQGASSGARCRIAIVPVIPDVGDDLLPWTWGWVVAHEIMEHGGRVLGLGPESWHLEGPGQE